MSVASFAVAACGSDDKDPPVEQPDPVCGNGLLESGEVCEGASLPEGCDPGTCTVQAGYVCIPEPPEPMDAATGGGTGAEEPPEWSSTCTLLPVCGNGVTEDGEACDDSDTAPGDGCDPSCQIEEGFSCAGEPSVCAACGDGFVDPGEECDAGENLGMTTPGCVDCAVFPGWECFNQPSLCGPECGDGMWFDTTIPGITQGFAEQCDDGNVVSGDGCGADCRIEDGCACDGNPPGISTCECGLTDSTDTGSESGTDTGTSGDSDGSSSGGSSGGSTDTGSGSSTTGQ